MGRRWFVLPAGGTELSYYKSDKAGAAAAGSIDCAGAHVFLKEVKGQTFRFTVRASTTRAQAARADGGGVPEVGRRAHADRGEGGRRGRHVRAAVDDGLLLGAARAHRRRLERQSRRRRRRRDAAAEAVGAGGGAGHARGARRAPRRAAVALAAGAAEGAARRADAAGAAAAAAGEDGRRRVVGQRLGRVGGESSKDRVERGRTEGWLEKKSGGKEGKAKAKVMEKWNKRCANEPPRRTREARSRPLTSSAPSLRRWFVLPAKGTELSYFKSQKDADQQKTAAGMLPCKGAKVFLKEVKGKTFRFTIQADKRTLKLRAVDAASIRCGSMPCLSNPGLHLHPSPPDHHAADRLQHSHIYRWIDALSPIADVSEEADPSSSRPSDMQSRVSVGDTDDSATDDEDVGVGQPAHGLPRKSVRRASPAKKSPPPPPPPPRHRRYAQASARRSTRSSEATAPLSSPPR